MTNTQTSIIAVLTVLMFAAAFGLGRWAEYINPDGIKAFPVAVDAPSTTPPANDASVNDRQDGDPPRNAFYFGASMGLLAMALIYATVVMGLLIRARSIGRKPDKFVFWLASLAGSGLLLSYLVDDYFY